MRPGRPAASARGPPDASSGRFGPWKSTSLGRVTSITSSPDALTISSVLSPSVLIRARVWPQVSHARRGRLRSPRSAPSVRWPSWWWWAAPTGPPHRTRSSIATSSGSGEGGGRAAPLPRRARAPAAASRGSAPAAVPAVIGSASGAPPSSTSSSRPSRQPALAASAWSGRPPRRRELARPTRAEAAPRACAPPAGPEIRRPRTRRV